MADAPWYKNAVFYEVHTRAFYDSDGDGIGDLKGLTQKLGYIRDLGITCVWLLPIYPSPLKDDGYDIADYYGIHPDLGTLKDFENLVSQCHKKGMRLIADLVVNHTSDQCEWFKKAEEDENSPYRDYYVWSDTKEKYQDARIIFLDTEDSNWAWSEKAQKYYWHRFYSSQPDLNYDNPAVREEMKNIMRFWLNKGIDGFRADAVPYLIEREGTDCENLPETHEYLKELRILMDEEYPDGILLAEANQYPQDLRPYFADGDEFHMAFHFPIMPRIFKSLAIQKSEPIIQIMNDTPPIPENGQWCTFLRNHDELTLEMVTEDTRQFMWDYYAPKDRMRLNLGIRRRLAPLMEGDMRKVELLYAILFSLPGAPINYYGDEIGMGDNIWLEDRNGVRTPMQWSSKKNAGFSDADESELFLPVIKVPEYSYKQINVELQKNDPGSFLNRLKNLISIRQGHPVFSSQNLDYFNQENPGVFSIVRSNKAERIYCMHNLTEETQTVPMKEVQFSYLPTPIEIKDLMDLDPTKIELPPFSYRWVIEKS